MAMHASRMTQDQNFSVHFDGAKMNGSTVKKNKGGLGGRKALNDISNSAKPSALQPLRKQNLKNVLPIGEDVGVGKKPLAKAQANVPYSIAEEGFRHNHDECVKQQKNVSFDDFNEFLHAIGHENDPLFQSVSTACKPLLPMKPKEPPPISPKDWHLWRASSNYIELTYNNYSLAGLTMKDSK
ncbi:patronus 1-like protein [Tanacetum coccineum]|uniref:Patronus 1-like protein n=1 Tax=Tanacetum coccineum TaxID=301880 RepID=A0ABQ5I4X2_9ASTR